MTTMILPNTTAVLQIRTKTAFVITAVFPGENVLPVTKKDRTSLTKTATASAITAEREMETETAENRVMAATTDEVEEGNIS